MKQLKWVAAGLLVLGHQAFGSSDADFVKARLVNDGLAVNHLQLELSLNPRHQWSHIMAPVGDFIQRIFNDDLVTMRYYRLTFDTAEGDDYSCVAGIGNNIQLSENAKYVEISDCRVELSRREKVTDLAVAP